jgi:rhodanese-related sulfurtransferase
MTIIVDYMSNREIIEVDLKSAVEMSKKDGSKFVWLGREPKDYISKILGIDSEMILKEDPEDIIYGDKERLKSFDECVFVCYHGNTSGFVSKFLKRQHEVNSYSLKGGITAIVGEIF